MTKHETDIVQYKSKFVLKTYFTFIFFIICIPIVMLRVSPDPSQDILFRISPFLLLWGFIHLLLFKMIKTITFDDLKMKMTVSYYFYSNKNIFYNEIKKVNSSAIITKRETIHLDLLKNTDELFKILKEKKLYPAEHKLKKNSKKESLFVYQSLFIAFISVIIFVTLDFNLGQYSKYAPIGIFILILFIMNTILIRRQSEKNEYEN